MSSCLSGGTARAYGIDLENLVKLSPPPTSSSSTSIRNSNSNSNSSSLSESTNSVTTVSTRKPRTPRKRPNQTYNEAAALLSTACPNIFSITKNKNTQSKSPNQHTFFFNQPSELISPFPENKTPINPKPREIEITRSSNRSPNHDFEDDFDTESLLDEEIGEGIESIIGNSNSNSNSIGLSHNVNYFNYDYNCNSCYGYPIGLGIGGNLEFRLGFGMRNGVRALRNVDEGNWWGFPAVSVVNVVPPATGKCEKLSIEKRKKVEENGSPLLLKLNYEKVMEAWSEKGSPLPEEMSGSESPGSDIRTKLAQIDLFSEDGGVREASMTRYKEKRRSRFFSKKIRYQVRKVNADQRPRSNKGRFVRRSNSSTCEDT